MARKKCFFKRSAKELPSLLTIKVSICKKLHNLLVIFEVLQIQIDFYLWKNCSEIVRICIRRDDDEKQERKYYSLGEKTNVI